MIHSQLFAGLGIEDKIVVQSSLDADTIGLNSSLLDNELAVARCESPDSYRSQALRLHRAEREKGYFDNIGRTAVARARFIQATRRMADAYGSAAIPINAFRDDLSQIQAAYDAFIAHTLPCSFINIVNASLDYMEEQDISLHALFTNSAHARHIYRDAIGAPESLEQYFAALDTQFTFGRLFYATLAKTVTVGLDRRYSIKHIRNQLDDTLYESMNLLVELHDWRAQHAHMLCGTPDVSVLTLIAQARDGDFDNPQKKIIGN